MKIARAFFDYARLKKTEEALSRLTFDPCVVKAHEPVGVQEFGPEDGHPDLKLPQPLW